MRYRSGLEDAVLSELSPIQLIRRGLERLEQEPSECVLVAPDETSSEAVSDFIAISLVSMKDFSKPAEYAEGEAGGRILAYRKWLPHPKETVAVRLEDDAMAPILPAGSVVAIDRSVTDPIKLQGRMVAASVDGVSMVRWLEVTGRHLILRPNNPSKDHPLIPVEFDGPHAGLILGQVVWSWSCFNEV